MLTKDQKIEVVRNRVNILETSIYNIEMLLIEENAKSQPIQIVIDELNSQKSEELLSLEAVSNKLEELLA
jgi:hypothetical protein